MELISALTTVVQAVGTLLIAGLLRELTRVLPGRFLVYWWKAWVCLAIALVAVIGAMRVEATLGPGHRLSVGLLIIYCGAEYAFGYLLWAGCRAFGTGREISRSDRPAVVVAAALAVMLPLALPTLGQLFGAHAAVMAALFFGSFLTIHKGHGPGPKHSGFAFIRPALGGLTLLFAHYAVVIGLLRYEAADRGFTYLNFTSVYDVILEIGLAFGMVLLAAERVRVELEERNRKLADAGTELAKAARTDPLTGLLNRRAFEEFAAKPDLPAGSVAILDINDLKPINDEYGHSAGDVTLKLIARSLRIHFRVTDPMFRLGGDEYAVIMPEGTADELAFRLTKIDAALVGQRLPGIDRPIDLTIAWGVAPYDSGEGLKAAAIRADERMYSQKKKRKGGSRSNLSTVLA